jgi:hypothetical protein
MFNNKDKQKEDSKVEIKVSPLFTRADTVRDTVTGITFTSSKWVEVEAKDAERLLSNNMDIFIKNTEEDEAELDEADSTVEDDEAVEDIEDTIEESHEDETIFEDSIGLDEQE